VVCNFAAETYAYLPEEIGAGYAERLRDLPVQEFQQRLEQRLNSRHAMLLEDGHPAPATLAICRTAREAAQEARQRA
jgi:hypothetical protein